MQGQSLNVGSLLSNAGVNVNPAKLLQVPQNALQSAEATAANITLPQLRALLTSKLNSVCPSKYCPQSLISIDAPTQIVEPSGNKYRLGFSMTVNVAKTVSSNLDQLFSTILGPFGSSVHLGYLNLTGNAKFVFQGAVISAVNGNATWFEVDQLCVSLSATMQIPSVNFSAIDFSNSSASASVNACLNLPLLDALGRVPVLPVSFNIPSLTLPRFFGQMSFDLSGR